MKSVWSSAMLMSNCCALFGDSEFEFRHAVGLQIIYLKLVDGVWMRGVVMLAVCIVVGVVTCVPRRHVCGKRLVAHVSVGALGVGVIAVSFVASEPDGVQKVRHRVALLFPKDEGGGQTENRNNTGE